MIWIKYQEHDYMDMYPSIGYRLFNSKNEAYEWEKHMNKMYSGGTTTVLGAATQEEILQYIKGMELDELTLSNINNKEYYESTASTNRN